MDSNWLTKNNCRLKSQNIGFEDFIKDYSYVFVVEPEQKNCSLNINTRLVATTINPKDHMTEHGRKMGWALSPDWTELTRECLLDIFSRLSMGKRWIGPMLVCKTWINVCQDPSLNTILDLEAEFMSSADSIYWWSPEFGEKVDSTIQSVVDQSEGGLKEIRVRHCTDNSLLYVAERCPNLEVLWVKYSPKVTKLKELDISCSYEISCECMEMVGTNCKNLQILKRNLMHPSEIARLRHCTFVQSRTFDTLGNVDAHTIGRHMRQLKHLELRFTTLTDRALANLCKQCSNLEYLDLFGCRYLTSDGVTNSISSLKNLKEIKKPEFTALFFD